MDESPIVTGWSAVATHLKIHEETARKLHDENGLPVSKIGGQIMTTTHLLERWVVKHVKVYMTAKSKDKK